MSQSESIAAIRARVEAARNRPHDYIAHLARDVIFLLVELEAAQDRIADAWDEGFQKACDETLSGFAPDGPTDEQNPYRIHEREEGL